MLMVDIFTTYTQIIPVKDKSQESILSALVEGFNKMGSKPEPMFSDDEPAYQLHIPKFFQEKNIGFLIRRTHARVAKRQIRTIKDMLNNKWNTLMRRDGLVI